MDARTQAETVLREVADPVVVDTAAKMADSGEWLWQWDPQHEDVVGLVEAEDRNSAVAIVYVGAGFDGEGDFETNAEFDSLIGAL